MAAVNSATGALQSWDPSADSYVLALKINSTNVVFGGQFNNTKFQARQNAARIDISAATVNAWNPQPDNQVFSLEKSGTKIFLGGDFSTVQSTPRQGLCAIDSATGNLLSFDARINGYVYSAKIVNNTIFTQGAFTTAANGDSVRNYAGAFNTTTGAATSWDPNLNTYGNNFTCFGYDNTNLIMGGAFTILNAKNRGYFAAMNITTGKISNLVMDCNSYVNGITTYGNKIYVSGSFTTVNSIARNYAFAFDEPSSTLLTFNPDSKLTSGEIDHVLQIGSKVYLGGAFTDSVSPNLVSVDTLGNTIAGWLPKANGKVYHLAGDTAQLLPVGEFTYFDYRSHPNLLALDASTGKVNDNFIAFTNSTVNGLSVLGNNIYAGGSFSTANDSARSNLAAFNKTTGTLQSWSPVASSTVNKVKNDGTTIYAVGSFTQIGVTARGCGASFSTSGTLVTWNPQADNYINDLWINGTNIYLGGAFTHLKTSARQFAGAISTANTVLSFDPSPNSYVYAITGNANHFYLGGNYNQISAQNRSGLASYNLSNNSLRTWNPSPSGTNYIYSLELAGNKLYTGGQFYDTIGGSNRYDIVAALDTSTGLATAFHPRNYVNVAGEYAYAVLPTCTDVFVGGYLINQNGSNYLAGYDNSITINRTVTQPTCTYSTNGAITLSLTNGYTPYAAYAWSNGATTSNITSLAVGTYTVTVTDAKGCTGTKSTSVVNQNPDPVATITASGPLTFCSGSSVNLTASANTSYSWNTSATTQAISVTTGGLYTVTVTGAGGCTKTSAPTTVTVSPSPAATIAITGPTTFCSGLKPLTLTANSGTGYTYKWKKATAFITGATAITYKPSASGTYTVQVTNPGGCSALSSGVVVTVNPAPIATITAQGATTFCAGDSVVLQANSGTGYTYLWKKGTATIAGATSQNYTARTAATYKVQVTNPNGCSKLSAGKIVTVNCRVTEDENESESIVIYPNPAGEMVTLQFTSSANQDYAATVCDIAGRELTHQTIEAFTGLNKKDFDLTMLASGIYMLKLKSANSEQVIRLVKE